MSPQCLSQPVSPPDIEEFGRRIHRVITSDLGFSDREGSAVERRLVSELTHRPREDALNHLGRFLSASKIRDAWNRVFTSGRAPTIGAWVMPFVMGRVLDLLCGSGAIGQWLADNGCSVSFADDPRAVDFFGRQTANTISAFSDRFVTSNERTFDTVLLVTELHHHTNWRDLLKQAATLSRRRLILIENCIQEDESSSLHCMADLFFNRALNSSPIDCPGTHATPELWVSRFEVYGHVIAHQRLRRVPGVPISHDMFVIDLKDRFMSATKGISG